MKSAASPIYPQQTSEFAAPLSSISDPLTLLVVDDDPAVRGLEADILSRQGYKVLQAGGAAEALRLALATEASHLLVTDFSMPETNGLELARRFRAVHPQAPVLMVSGSLAAIHPLAKDLNRFAVIGKPFAA